MGRWAKILIVSVIVAACAGIFFYLVILKPAANKTGPGQDGSGANFGKALSSVKELVLRNSGKIFFRIENKLLDEEEPGKKYRKILFRYDGPKAQKVCISGEFNDWADELMENRNSGIWEKTKALLPEVEYTYLFVVDGVSVPDPANPNTVDLGIRGKASIVPAGAEDIHAPAAKIETNSAEAVKEKQAALNEKVLVSGIVCDKNGRAISGAIIRILRGGKEIERMKSVKDGSFPKLQLDSGQYVFKIWKDKYNARSIKVELGNAPSKRFKFTLSRQ